MMTTTTTIMTTTISFTIIATTTATATITTFVAALRSAHPPARRAAARMSSGRCSVIAPTGHATAATTATAAVWRCEATARGAVVRHQCPLAVAAWCY